MIVCLWSGIQGGERLWSGVSDGEEARKILTENPGHQME